jgi:hypothetical protein
MEVSHFELVWKPQSPATPIGQSGIDRVFQGYFLKLTNLEDKPLSFALSFVAATAAVPERSLAGNTVVFIDTPGTNNALGTLNGNIASTVFTPSTGNITIPAQATALIAVLPSAFNGLPVDPTPLAGQNFEVRGFVRLRLPAVFKLIQTPLGPRFVRVAQSDKPVRVMLTPQHRATYYNATGALSDQTQSSIPTASGAAVNMVPPDQPFVFPFPLDLDLDLTRLERLSALIDDEDRGTMLAALLSSLDGEKVNLSGMNTMLAKAGIELALEKRKSKVGPSPVPAA